MIQDVHISGYLNEAIYRKGKNYFRLKIEQPPVRVRQSDVNIFFNFGREIQVFDQLKETELEDKLAQYSDLYDGLDLAIKATNKQFSNKLKNNILKALELHLELDEVYQFVHTRMISKPATEDVDILTSLQLAQAQGYEKSAQLYRELIDAQPTITLFWEVWNELKYVFFKTPEDILNTENQLLESGIFAKINQRLQTAKKLKHANEIIFYVPSNLIHFFQKIAQRFAEKQNIQAKSHGAISDISNDDTSQMDEIEILISEFDNKKENEFLHNADTRVAKKVAGIIRSIKRNRLDSIDKDLTDLINFHIKYSQREHLCKSLTKIASETVQLHQYDLAKRFIRYAQIANHQDPAPYRQQAELYKAQNKLDDAEKLYKTVIDKFPQNAITQNGLAEVYKAQNKFNDAEILYKQVIQKFPQNVVAQTGLAEIYKAQNKFNDAEKLYKEVIQKFPQNVVAQNGLAEIYKAQNKFNNAEKLYNAIIQKFPQNAVAQTGYLHTLILAEKYEEVEALIKNETSTPLSHSDWVFHHTVSMYFLKRGNLNEAIQRLEYGVKKSSILEQPYYNTALAFALNKKGQHSNFQKALQHLEDYSVPVDRYAEHQLQQAMKAVTYASLNQEEKAKEIIRHLDMPVSRPHREILQLTQEYIEQPPAKRPAIIRKMEQPFLLALAA